MNNRQLTQARIRARIRDFDIPALLDLLAHLGYEPGDITYRGHPSASPQPSLVQDIVFSRRDDRDTVEIVLNLGLVSCRTPLPSYFIELLTHVDTADALRELLGFIDQSLLKARCRAYRPERSMAAWPRAKGDLLALTGCRSPAEVHAIFARFFPELDVLVTRGAGEKTLHVGTARIGLAELGECAFGTYARAPAHGLRVTLFARERESRAGVPWRAEAGERLRRYLLPLFGDTCMYLVVELVMLIASKTLQLDGDSSIGYEPLPGGPSRPLRVTLFRGRLMPAEVNDPASHAGQSTTGQSTDKVAG